jgi:Spy/CpxP family protein refolding chaperone
MRTKILNKKRRSQDKMKNRVIFLTVIVAVVFMVLSMASFADARSRGNFGGRSGASNFNGPGQFNAYQGDNFRGMMNLDLSAEQLAQVREIMLDSQKETLELRNQIQVKQLELRELRLSQEADMEQVRAKLEEISELQIELRIKAFERQEKVKDLLTPEQVENCNLGMQMQRFGYGMERNNSGQGFKGNQEFKGNRW